MEQRDTSFIDEMTKMIIRPHRDIYTIEKLGPLQMIIKSKTVTNNDRPAFKYVEITRRDQVVDCKGKKIQLSYFSPPETETKKNDHYSIKSKRCVVYLHANSGSRIEGLDLVKYVLPFGWSMAIFDYRGSGVSDGEYTSMGVNQSEDLEKVLQYLRSHERVNQFCLWGRSMGAVTILYYLTKHYYWNNLHSGTIVRAVVLDSPFSSMQKLMYQVGSSKTNLPQFLFSPVINSIIERLTSKLGFNLVKELDLIERVNQLKEKNFDSYKLIGKISALLITSLEDKLVNSSHVEALHQHYPFYPNDLHYFNGQHSDNRSDTLKNKCAQFLCEIPERKQENIINVTPLRPELQTRKATEQFKKEIQFTGAHRKDVNSPKLRHHKDMILVVEEPLTHQRQGRDSKIIEETRNSRTQDHNHNSTIIINNSYNVSVNLFESPKPTSSSCQNGQEEIPSINFKGDQPQGYMTDRMADNHVNHKYFGPYTTKVEKKEYQYGGYNLPFNISSPTSSSQPTVSPFHKNDGSKLFQKDLNNQNFSQIDSKSINIPRIKFEGINYNFSRQEETRQKLSIKDAFQRKKIGQLSKLGPPPQLMQHLPQPTQQIMYSSQPQKKLQTSQKTKLPLAQLRKLQKQQQQKCVMKTSKLIYLKNKKDLDQSKRLHLKSQGSQLQDIPSQHEKWSQQNIQRMNSAGSREMRSLKTSLMQKRKTGERKNSEAAQHMKESYLNQLNKHLEGKEKTVKQAIQNSQKLLNFKFKIEHL